MVPRSFCGQDRSWCDAVGQAARNEDSMLDMQGNMYCFGGNQKKAADRRPAFLLKSEQNPAREIG